MQKEENQSEIGFYLTLATGYLVLLASFGTISIFLDIEREKQSFFDYANYTHSHIDGLLKRNMLALHGFAALLQIEEKPSPKTLRTYVNQVFNHHPDLGMLAVAQTVTYAELSGFIRSQQLQGMTDYQVRACTESPFVGQWSPVAKNPVYYPLTFLEPLLPEIRDVLGFDLGSSEDFRIPLQKSFTTNALTMTKPFPLSDKQMGFMLIHRLPGAYPERFALSICNADNLLPSRGINVSSTTLGIYYDEGRGNVAPIVWLIREAAKPEDSPFSGLFPVLSMTRALGGPSQPLMLKVEKRLDWRIVNRGMLATIFIGGFASLPLLFTAAYLFHRRELRRLKESNRLFYLANFDGLTGLPNRQLFRNRLDQALAVASRQGLIHALLFLDLDGFKEVNDYYGHQIGDMVLKRAARIFQRSIREVDTVARLGGDEFVILLQNIAARKSAEHVARKIKKAFFLPVSGSNKSLPLIGVSIGIALFPDDGGSADELMNAADQDMYRDKQIRKSSPGIN